MNKKSDLFKIATALTITFAIGACTPSDKGKNDNSNPADTTTAITKEKSSKAKKVFSTIPSPVETAQILKDAGAKYNPAYLNNAENASKYSTVKAIALKLGIYGSDLSFISLFDQTQESLLYLKCTNTLASGLGITGAFDDNTTTRISDNMDKTVVIKVKRTFIDPRFKKVVRTIKKYKVHDEKQQAKVGDVIEIFEGKPISKTKYMYLHRVVKAAATGE